MSLLNKFLLAPKALGQLGARPLVLYASYQFKLRSGLLRLQTPPSGRKPAEPLELEKIVQPATRGRLHKVLGEKQTKLFSEAEEILSGKVRLFGAAPQPLNFEPPLPLRHWSLYASGMPGGGDIKPVWEIGRFCWATVLARAYWLSGAERYAEKFWALTERFFKANPVNMGTQWSSAQEVALRLIALAFCYSLLAEAAATVPERRASLAQILAAHAERIPPTLDYARAQNNNHLLSEALGLYTAAALLPRHPRAAKWRHLGREIFLEGIDSQIHSDGSYAQHSANYHRLMLQLGVWFTQVANSLGESVPKTTQHNLGKAAKWLLKLLDEESGQVPNLGPNDGAYILALTALGFEDYRPALQAAGFAFENQAYLQSGDWDEMALWLGLKGEKQPGNIHAQHPLRLDSKNSWAYFRVAEFRERPGHADQLHVDLWWNGLNLAQDAGSYLYTAAAPWNNALSSTRVHNTVMAAGREQMTRAGRFLWLDWAQGKIISTKRARDGRLRAAVAEHDGYRKLGMSHRREVRVEAGERWVISDYLLPVQEKQKPMQATLHWLLPDWPWQFENETLRLRSPQGSVELLVETSVGDLADSQLMRAGELLHGNGRADPVLGWRSPTYGVKLPALSFSITVTGLLPITITSTWMLPDAKHGE